MAVSMQTPISSFGNFGQTVSDSINKQSGRVHDAKMQAERLSSVEGMHNDSLKQQRYSHKIDSMVKFGISKGTFEGLNELESYFGGGYIDYANKNLSGDGTVEENYKKLSSVSPLNGSNTTSSNNESILGTTLQGTVLDQEDKLENVLGAYTSVKEQNKEKKLKRDAFMKNQEEGTWEDTLMGLTSSVNFVPNWLNPMTSKYSPWGSEFEQENSPNMYSGWTDGISAADKYNLAEYDRNASNVDIIKGMKEELGPNFEFDSNTRNLILGLDENTGGNINNVSKQDIGSVLNSSSLINNLYPGSSGGGGNNNQDQIYNFLQMVNDSQQR